MSWGVWIPALSSSTATAAAALLLGTLYKAQAERSVRGKLDGDIGVPESRMRREEQHTRRDLDAEEDKVSAPRSAGLSGSATPSPALEKRRVQAVEALWSCALAHGHLRTAITMTKAFDLEKAMELSARGDADARKIRALADSIWKACRLDEVKDDLGGGAARERPFLSPMAWALYCAYSTMLAYPVCQLEAVRAGTGGFSQKEQLTNLMKTALPDLALLIDRYGTSALPHLLDTMEERLLSELKSNLEGRETDRRGIKPAARILKAVSDVEAAKRRTRGFRNATKG